MDVDLRAVDIAFISHGHYDHGGGLKTFLQLNGKAPVHLCAKAFEKHFASFESGGIKFVGLDTALLENDRFVFVGENSEIDGELETFSNVVCLRLNPTGNADLLKEDGSSFVPDDFAHEQNLIVRAEGKTVLISGCSHCGIVNILERFRAERGAWPDTVIGGFHLYNPARNVSENPELVREIAEYLLGTGAKFYTCHCTGLESYKRLKDIMGDSIDYLSGGMTLAL
jgi:7,8-dihydropterin-6-yl-methyl-4-(beta-D-ribofuranosyl)aminobenzene 5'-phosphate synthase